MAKLSSYTKEISASSFYNREIEFKHHPYDKEMRKFHLLRDGSDEALVDFKERRANSNTGKLSNDALRNAKYLFVATTTLTTRFAIEGGLDAEDSYTISDVFIRRADQCTSTEAIESLCQEMFTYFLRSVQKVKQSTSYSKPIIQCTNYIKTHLHDKLSLHVLSDAIGLSPTYLSSLFKKELHMTTTDYITAQKIEAAKNLLCFTDYSISQLSTYFAFSSESRFIQVFRNQTGLTPKNYRNTYYNKNF